MISKQAKAVYDSKYRTDNKTAIAQRKHQYYLTPNGKLVSQTRTKRWLATPEGRFLKFGQKLRLRYSIDRPDFDRMLVEQTGRCLICNNQFLNNNKEPHVDHDHLTGIIRGLLCGRCNRLLGMVKDSIQLLLSAVSYLQRNSTWTHH